MQTISNALSSFYLQHRSQIFALVGLLMLLFFILSVSGVVMAEPGTGGGACSGC
jgi:hypothetical protein